MRLKSIEKAALSGNKIAHLGFQPPTFIFIAVIHLLINAYPQKICLSKEPHSVEEIDILKKLC